MRHLMIRPGGSDLGRLTATFAGLSVVFVTVLAVAPLRPYFDEWRRVQRRYNELARGAGAAPIPIAIQQIWKPRLGVTDRCITCHLGMGAGAPVAGDRLFAAHPPIPHDPRELGCTVCHGGQGRATTKDAAHGFVSHWDEQLLDRRHQAAGCGACHDDVPWIPRDELARGQMLVESLDCLSCHRLDGRGRGDAPALTFVGLTGYRADWHADHLRRRAAEGGAWTASYGDIPAPDVAAIDAFLRTRVGAPRLVEAWALAFERGCLGCHKIGGRGGDEGPALDTAGARPVGDLNFSRVKGPRTLTNYMRAHLLDPPGVVPASVMPPQSYSEEEVELLTTFVLSRRRRAVPMEYLPKERARRDLLGEAPPLLEGSQVFGAYCTGCHGPRGEGRQYPNIDTRFPSIGAADFLDVAPPGFIEQTIKEGRPGRRMPGLAAPGGSIRPEELTSLVSYLRRLAPPPPSIAEVAAAGSNAARGETTYRRDCAACHGEAGEGTPLGSPLATPDSRVRGRRRAAYQAVTAGVAGTAMPGYSIYDAATLRSLLDHLDRLPVVPGSRAGWTIGRGEAASGAVVYERACAGCHGARGEGKTGPALANPAFQRAATAAYIAATVVRGRQGAPMPAFGRDNPSYPRLAAGEVLDVTTFVLEGLGGRR